MSETNEFEQLNKLNSLLKDMDERGLVLTLSAFAEESLGYALSAFMMKNKSGAKLLDGFNAPLGTFSSRIQAAHALGIVTEDQYEDLEHLRKIRNHFSHTWQPVSLDSSPARDHVDALCYSYFEDVFPVARRDKLRSSIGSLLLEVQVVTNELSEKSSGAKVIGSRVTTYAGKDPKETTAKCVGRIREIDDDIDRSVGKERDFHMMLRERWIGKLELVAALSSPSDRADVLEVIQKIRMQR